MNKPIKKKILITILIILIITGIIIFFSGKNKTPEITQVEINPHRGSISTYVSTTGTVEPQNRVEITSPLAGRIEKILVREGDKVKVGQILIWMSSTDRAALMDAARVQGDKQDKYWEKVYKPIPLVAPISGTIIARNLEPGQSVTTSTVILVISNRLMVTANVDETDVGKVKKGHQAEISLDAYPDVKVTGRVIHINFESTTVNNVTVYEIKIKPDKVPAIFKSGMSANIKICSAIKENVLLIPSDSLIYDNGRTFVSIKRPDNKIIRTPVETGLDDNKNVEIISGLTDADIILSTQQKLIMNSESKENGNNPFMPRRPGQSRSKKK